MKNSSGSTLAKLSFMLLLLITAGVGYLVVVKQDRRLEAPDAEPIEVPDVDENRGVAQVPPAVDQPQYAPLRPRPLTNVAGAPTNRAQPTAANSPQPARGEVVNSVVARTPANEPTPPDFRAFAGADSVVSKETSVRGRAVLQGKAPAEKTITMDPACGRLQKAPITTRHYVVGSEGALANAFVYIKAGAPVAPTSTPGPLLDQIACEYQPYMFGVQTGQTFRVRNSDPLLHNVHSLPKVPGNKERNVGQPVKNMVTPFVFAKREVFIQFKCDVHPWMFAYVGVVDHPWFAVTDKDGNFSLPGGLPPGRYTLAAVHLKAGEILHEIDVSTDTAPVTFTFKLPESLTTQTKP